MILKTSWCIDQIQVQYQTFLIVYQILRQALRVSSQKFQATTKPNKQVLFTSYRPGTPLFSLRPTPQTYSFQK